MAYAEPRGYPCNHRDGPGLKTQVPLLLDNGRSVSPGYSWRSIISYPAPIYECHSDGHASLALDRTSMSAQLRQHQIIRIVEFGHENLHRPLPKKAIASAFAVNPEVVRHAGKGAYSVPCSCGRHPKLSDEIERELHDQIQEKAQDEKAAR